MMEARIESQTGAVIPLVSVDVRGELAGVFLRMAVQQQFRNPTQQPMEVTYSFPLPHEAVLLQAEIHIRGEIYLSHVDETPSARAKFDKSIKAGDTAILISHDADFYTLRLGNVPAGEDVVIRIRYGEWMLPNDGVVRVSLPTTIAPRYGAAPTQLTDDQVPVTHATVQYPFTYQLQVHGRSVAQVTVPSHIARIEPVDGGVSIAIDGASMDRDVVVQVQGYADYRANMTTEYQRQHWHGSYMTIPRRQNAASDKPMHIKLLIDCSGSMGGTSIAQARQAVMRLLGMLRDGDSIAVTRFGSDVADVTPGLMTVGPVIRKQMNGWIKTIEADLGGTEIAAAVNYVINMPTHDQPCDIIVLTDGEAWGIKKVAAHAKATGHRIFPVVIGYTPSDGDLQALAKMCGGFCESVTPNERIDDAIGRITRRLQSQTAQTVKMDFGDAVVAWESGYVPQYDGETSMLVTVTDRTVAPHFSADAHQETLPVVTMPATMTEDFVRTLAARRLHDLNGDSQTKWAVTHQLVAAQTSIVAVAVHAADAKVQGEAFKAVVMQEMAYDWHGGVQNMKAFPAPTMAFRAANILQAPVMHRSSSAGSMQGNVSSRHTRSAPPRGLAEQDDSFAVDASDSSDSFADTVLNYVSTLMPSARSAAPTNPLQKYEKVAQKALKLAGNGTLTLDHLRKAGLDRDIIDALGTIAGYREDQIAAAVVCTILGVTTLPSGTKVLLPTALMGGVKIILETA